LPGEAHKPQYSHHPVAEVIGHLLAAQQGERADLASRGVESGGILALGWPGGSGGQACVNFAPTDENGQEIMSEHKGIDRLPVIPGLMIISDLNFTWTVGENWSGFYAALNHWAPIETQDLGCANGHCEGDDWLIVEFH
jgi:hypothetical protein